MAERGRKQGPSERAFTALFFVLVAAVLLFSDKGQIAGDGEVRWRTLVALMENGRVTPDRYTLEMPLAATPLWAAGSVAASAEGLTGRARFAVVQHFVQRFNKLVAFALAAWLYRELRRHRFLPQDAARGVLGLLFLTLLIPNAKDFYSECLWTLLVCVALGLLVREGRTRAEGLGLAIAVALAVPLSPVLAPVLVVTAVAAALFATPMDRHAAWGGAFLAAAGAGFGVCLGLAENFARRGSASRFRLCGSRFHDAASPGPRRSARLARARRSVLSSGVFPRRAPPRRPPCGRRDPPLRRRRVALRRLPDPRLREVGGMARR